MKEALDKRAVWIFDEYFLLPGLLSIYSFYEYNDLPGTVYYCEKISHPTLEQTLNELSAEINIQCIEIGEEYKSRKDYKTILNRLVRMQVMRKHVEEIVFLFDADIVFADSIMPLIQQSNIAITEEGIDILGHYEEQIAHNSYLYFRSPRTGQFEYSLSSQTEQDIYTECFGPDWLQLIGTPGYNNGVLIFYNCKDLANEWETIYRKGIEKPIVNASDDQLPLIAACNQLNSKKGSFDKIYNSLGELNTPYVILHAFGNAWKSQIVNAIDQEFRMSTFAEISHKHLKRIPSKLVDTIIDDYKEDKLGWQYTYPDRCKYVHLFSDILNPLKKGRIVEVGTSSVQSIVFAAEYIIKNNKSVQIDAIYNEGSGYTKMEFEELMEDLNTTKVGPIITPHLDTDTFNCERESIDLVFINSTCNTEELNNLLIYFYPFIKPGGLLAGYDYGAQDGIYFGGTSGSFNFARAHKLNVSIDFNIFLIPKPNVLSKLKTKEKEISVQKTTVI